MPVAMAASQPNTNVGTDGDHAHARCKTCTNGSPPPGAWWAKSWHQASISVCGMSLQAQPSHAPKSASIRRSSITWRQPHRLSQRPTSWQRRKDEVWMQRGQPCRRACARMRCAKRLALRWSTGRSVRPMQRPCAPLGLGCRQAINMGETASTAVSKLKSRPGEPRPTKPGAPRLRPVAGWHPGCRR